MEINVVNMDFFGFFILKSDDRNGPVLYHSIPLLYHSIP